MSIEEIRARLVACPIPKCAVADYVGTNHYEITTSARTAKDAAEYWWLDGVDTLFATLEDWSATETGKRLGACLDYATHYKRDVDALLARIAKLERQIEKTARRCAQIADNYIGNGVAAATIRREFKL